MAIRCFMFQARLPRDGELASGRCESEYFAGAADLALGICDREISRPIRVHDDLWAKALVIEDRDGNRAALVTMDLVGHSARDLAEVCKQLSERYKLPRAAIAHHVSHTHSGPVVRGNLMAMYSLDEDQSRRINEYRTATRR